MRMMFSTHKYPLSGATVHKMSMIFLFRCPDTILFRKWLTMDVWR